MAFGHKPLAFFLNLCYPLLIHMFSLLVKSGPGHRYFQEKEEERTGRQVSDTIRYSGGMIWINPLVSSEHITLNWCGVSSLIQWCTVCPDPKSRPWGGRQDSVNCPRSDNSLRIELGTSLPFSKTRHVQWLVEKLRLTFPTRPLSPPERDCAARTCATTRGRAPWLE